MPMWCQSPFRRTRASRLPSSPSSIAGVPTVRCSRANTSSLLPSMYAEASGRPDRLAALHFHQPVWSANLVDVMPHSGTSPETIEILLGFAARIGQIPIQLHKESPGYVFNAMYNALNREAITLATNGVAGVEDIDLAWTTVMKTAHGPFGMLDFVGSTRPGTSRTTGPASPRTRSLLANAGMAQGLRRSRAHGRQGWQRLLRLRVRPCLSGHILVSIR